nr:unnamed protein product [Spirometra erinaceieuropaei]
MTLASGANKRTSWCTSGDFVKRVFFAFFDDETAIHIKGKKTKKGLFGSQVYDVIKVWNRGAPLSWQRRCSGNNLDDLVQRILFALFEDEIGLHVNSRCFRRVEHQWRGQAVRPEVCLHKATQEAFGQLRSTSPRGQ